MSRSFDRRRCPSLPERGPPSAKGTPLEQISFKTQAYTRHCSGEIRFSHVTSAVLGDGDIATLISPPAHGQPFGTQHAVIQSISAALTR